MNVIRSFFTVTLFLSIFSASSAPIFVENENYISHTYNGVSYDLTWASPYNVQFYTSDISTGSCHSIDTAFADSFLTTEATAPIDCLFDNQLLGPNYGWSFYDSSAVGLDLMSLLMNAFNAKGLASSNNLFNIFVNSNNEFINSFDVWNTSVIDAFNVDTALTLAGSDFTKNSLRYAGVLDAINDNSIFSSTVYIRESSPKSTSVSEPSSMLIFAFGLLAIAVRTKKVFSLKYNK